MGFDNTVMNDIAPLCNQIHNSPGRPTLLVVAQPLRVLEEEAIRSISVDELELLEEKN